MEELYQKLSESTVPTASIVCMTVTVVLTVAMPALLALYLKKKYDCNLKALLVGALTFMVFARIVEATVHQVVLKTSLGDAINGNMLFYGLYGGIMAAIFEEVGRLLVMKTALKDCYDNDKNSLMFGVGHGGMECILILGLPMISCIVYSKQINEGGLEPIYQLIKTLPEEQAMASLQSLLPLVEQAPTSFLLGMIERIPALAIHMALSVLVWKTVRENRYLFFGLALLFHFLVDFLSVMVTTVTTSVFLIEAAIYVFAIIVVAITYFLCKKSKTDYLIG